MILEATHPGVPKSLTEIAGRLYRPALEAADGPPRPLEP